MLSVVGRHADAATFDALLEMMLGATETEDKWQLQGALREVADRDLVERMMALLLSDALPPGDAIYNLCRLGAENGRADQVWQFIKANLAAVYAKSTPHGKAMVLPTAAAPFSEAARADELLALTRANLDATALYQAEKTADWIRLKAAVKARDERRAVLWAGRTSRRAG